ncbi:MAG TPA: helix-turn-helix transcriptional regulator [Phycisphaerae bacterium]|jgi:putative transcriptional regulator
MKNRLKVLRAERDWTQADLADLAAVARQTIVALENGKYSPSLELAFRFASIFGKRVDEIFEPPIDDRLAGGNE